MSIEAEVSRLLARRALPKLPRTTSELTVQLGRGLSEQEHRLRNEASRLGGVKLAGEVEKLILGGATVEALRAHLDEAADALVTEMNRDSGSAGAEAARILSENARSR